MSADVHPARRSIVVRALRGTAGAALACLVLAPGSRAEIVEYSWTVPDRNRVNYEVPLEVRYAGEMVVDVEWDGGRILAFRLDGPDGLRVRRGGPSPQRLEAEVAPRDDGAAATYVLSISALPATGRGDGLLRVRLPDAPEVVAAREEAARPKPPPPPQPEPWMVRVEASEGAAPDRAQLYAAIEELRARLVDEVEWSLGPDPCRWQEGALRYLGGLRDRIAAGGPVPDVATRRYFQQVAEAGADVEAFRLSDDPILAGPVPEDPGRRRVWLLVREQRVRPLERQLDHLLVALEDGFVPELETEDWPRKMISCVMACQRHFDEVALEGIENAGNARLADSEWASLRAAARAFEAASMLSASEGAPTP